MRVLIIEDELPACAKLEDMLKKLQPDVTVIARLGSVKETIKWLTSNIHPDFAFVDIQLSDDHSFEIFRQLPVKFPVIFTTAYDKYLLESFEFNSIDYLLKPITEERLDRTLKKIRDLETHFLHGNLLKLIQAERPKNRIIGKKGTEFIALELDEVAYFFTEHKVVFVRDFSGRQLILDRNLAEIEEQLDKTKFFRINRKFIAQLKAIERFKPDNGKVRIFLIPEMKEEIHVSKETAPQFRTWMENTVGMKMFGQKVLLSNQGVTISTDALCFIAFLLEQLNNFIAMISLDKNFPIFYRTADPAFRFQQFTKAVKIVGSTHKACHQCYLFTCPHTFVQLHFKILLLRR